MYTRSIRQGPQTYQLLSPQKFHPAEMGQLRSRDGTAKKKISRMGIYDVKINTKST